MSNLRWERNDGGITLLRWMPEELRTYGNTTVKFTVYAHWHAAATVHKAKRGDRYVVRIQRPTTSMFEQYSAFTLREAMRMAKFLVGVSYG